MNATVSPVLLQAFFSDRLLRQRHASPHTIAAYRDTFRLLLRYAQNQLGKAPSYLCLEDLDAPLIGRFLQHLESQRGNRQLRRLFIQPAGLPDRLRQWLDPFPVLVDPGVYGLI